jgi:hypothetical protein
METTKPDTDIILNHDNTAAWEVKFDSEILGSIRGQFIFKTFLNPIEILSAGKLYRDLLGPNSHEASEQERFLAFSLSQLKYRIVKAPPFWQTDSIVSGNIPDLNLVSLILEKAISAESLYKDKLKEKRTKALETSKNSIAAIQEALNVTEKGNDQGE